MAGMHARTYAVRRVCARQCSGPAEAETPPPLSAPAPPAAGEGGTPPLHLGVTGRKGHRYYATYREGGDTLLTERGHYKETHREGGDTATTLLTERGHYKDREGARTTRNQIMMISHQNIYVLVQYLYAHVRTKNCGPNTVYDRIDAAATINFSTQFGAATIRERRLFESGVYFVWRGYRKVNTSTRIVY